MAIVSKKKTIYFNFGKKHIDYIRNCVNSTYNIAEGAVRAGKTVDNVYAFAHELYDTEDKIHLASGSTSANAKLNIGDANGFGLEYIFRGQSRWGKYKGNECLYIKGVSTRGKERIVIFAGGAKADSFKKIRGNSYGMWIATEINLHHENTIKEAFNRQLAAKKRKIFWDLNPDNPNAKIYTDYIDKYAELSQKGKLQGGYNYEHFTIKDNVNIPQERIDEIISQYDPKSVWYMRDIEGKRAVAEGLIYRIFSDDHQAKIYSFRLDGKPANIMQIIVGVDFGGSGSAHAFVATGITRDMKVVALCSKRIPCDKEEIDPEQLGELFIDFCRKVIHLYGPITVVYVDSAEQTLKNGLRNSSRKAGLYLRIENAIKEQINERIRFVTRLMAQGRFKYMEKECESLVNALCTAIWDPKKVTINERLDDGTSDIDTLDAFEYTIERLIAKWMREER